MRFISVTDIDKYWDECLNYLRKSFIFSIHIDAIEDYYEPLKAGTYQLWMAIDYKIKGAAITMIEQGSQGKLCNIIHFAGEDIRDWIKQMDEALTLFARANGCLAVQAVSRPGFSKLVPEFFEDGRVYIKKIGD